MKLYKITTVGDNGCGRTVLISYLKTGRFSRGLPATLGVDFSRFDIAGGDKLQFWDIPGQERYLSCARSFYRSANAFIVAIDATNISSREGARRWIEDIRQQRADNEFKLILILTKCDRVLDNREAKIQEFYAFAASMRVDMCIELSALDGINTTDFLQNVHACVSQSPGVIVQQFGAAPVDHVGVAPEMLVLGSIRSGKSCLLHRLTQPDNSVITQASLKTNRFFACCNTNKARYRFNESNLFAHDHAVNVRGYCNANMFVVAIDASSLDSLQLARHYLDDILHLSNPRLNENPLAQVIVVLNKSDLSNKPVTLDMLLALAQEKTIIKFVIETSAKTSLNLHPLLVAIEYCNFNQMDEHYFYVYRQNPPQILFAYSRNPALTENFTAASAMAHKLPLKVSGGPERFVALQAMPEVIEVQRRASPLLALENVNPQQLPLQAAMRRAEQRVQEFQPPLSGQAEIQRRQQQQEQQNQQRHLMATAAQYRLDEQKRLQAERVAQEKQRQEQQRESERLDSVPDDLKCKICFFYDDKVGFVPCGHMGACERCAELIMDSNKKCPYCRTTVTSFIKLYPM